jgi:hypothetical protein
MKKILAIEMVSILLISSFISLTAVADESGNELSYIVELTNEEITQIEAYINNIEDISMHQNIEDAWQNSVTYCFDNIGGELDLSKLCDELGIEAPIKIGFFFNILCSVEVSGIGTINSEPGGSGLFSSISWKNCNADEIEPFTQIKGLRKKNNMGARIPTIGYCIYFKGDISEDESSYIEIDGTALFAIYNIRKGKDKPVTLPRFNLLQRVFNKFPMLEKLIQPLFVRLVNLLH